eukprot:TRINITY_DN106_c0_g2_i2.p1 TRINITY_DN106_c0_g2~~TRINITY_DN106_c0_g2_i2.p1  ORF type:complete len:193 (+),score=57.16 TRINITY_DN106_c0_g2_i2:47-580(+)
METSSNKPNILVTGTPGTGKTTFCEVLAERTELKHVNIGDLVREHDFHAGRDEEFDCFLIDEDSENRLLDHLEPLMAEGGVIIDHHSCDFFPERFFHLVLVMTTENAVLFDRLSAREYTEKKVRENMECEIMQVVQEEAKQSYEEDIVQVLTSNTPDDMDTNLDRTVQWIEMWTEQQ